MLFENSVSREYKMQNAQSFRGLCLGPGPAGGLTDLIPPADFRFDWAAPLSDCFRRPCFKYSNF